MESYQNENRDISRVYFINSWEDIDFIMKKSSVMSRKEFPDSVSVHVDNKTPGNLP